ncbi:MULTISPECIES: hormogonium polysaccharide secretion pseudopilin HpsB [Calothrix]|uniref:Type II secretion system protein n=2 Tax=Calothrix TaxID=1186 RepID=A0ABR8AD88_9CYAN|nr:MULTISPECIES: hormogonium polysaccharide secretion pseudopilin HpsB [Calothrix]MBD2196492.1 type II secretion system protein [Calothrix parietina FACHB-288]MBD2224613.1 type II secretion system protein [Calothrix anomala FACHB-343]
MMLKYPIPPTSRESGFTIIESLIAMVVVAILMVAIAPVIVFSTATRVQSRRIELATQAAKTYIEGVRTGAILVDNAALQVDTTTYTSINAFPAPAVGALTCSNNSYCSAPAANLYCIDGDNNGSCTTNNSKDFVIQAFRYNKNSTNPTTGYLLGVRVYRADGFTNDGSLQKAPAKQKTVTGGLGERKTPLVEMISEISSQTGSFNDLCNRLKTGTTGTNNSCN